MTGLSDAERELVAALPADSLRTLADELDLPLSTTYDRKDRVDERKGHHIEKVDGQWVYQGPDAAGEPEPETEPDVDAPPDPSAEDLTERETYIVRELQTAATLDELAAGLNEPPAAVRGYLEAIDAKGWDVYHDETADLYEIDGDHQLRSSEHKGTRTRKANRWWELRHSALVREFRRLDPPQSSLDATAGHEDWVTHLTDLHAGDRVRQDDGTVVYETSHVPKVIDYVTERSLSLADKHNSTYDAAHLLWGGDFLTNEAIYEGQFEDLDAWLDEQHETLVEPLVRQLKAFAERFPTVQVVTIVGNHGQHRASGTSRQANADLILYKHIRNVVAHLQEHAGLLENITMHIGDAAAYRNFPLRGGELRGHLRHGQHRKPQAETSARKKEWQGTLLDHDFDVAHIGHHHISGRIPWDGPPIICSPSPKPAGEFVERLGGRLPGEYEDVATAHGVSDDGITSVFPIDTRGFEP